MTRADEVAICTSCTLRDCVGKEHSSCPLKMARQLEAKDRQRQAQLRAAGVDRKDYFKARYQQRKAERSELRGYWPEIHGPLE